MSDEFWASENGEVYRHGPFASFADAKAEMATMAIDSCYIGKRKDVDLADLAPDGAQVFEWAEERLYGLIGEAAEGQPGPCSSEAIHNLTAVLNRAWCKWAERHEVKVTGFQVVDARQVEFINAP